MYLKTLLAELKDLNPESEHLEEALFSLGIYLNVNAVEAVHYFIDLISSEINLLQEPELKRRKLMQWLRKVNQLPVKANFVFKPRLASLKEQIGAWIAEEMDFLEKEFILSPTSTLGQNHEEETKVNTSLSVPQLALLIRAAKDAGIITNKNQTALLKTIAKVFDTPNTEAISAESLRIKYYVAESGAKQTLKDLLMEMYKKLHSY